MDTSKFAAIIAAELNLKPEMVRNTMSLLDEGCTIPFISRYRKERTGALDEVQIAAINDSYTQLKELAKRKETILKTISSQERLTPELEKRIEECWDSTTLEDLYLPFKPRRRTRAQIAREQGLEPFATALMKGLVGDPEREAAKYVGGTVGDADAAIAGAQDIIAEIVSEDERSRQQVRGQFRRTARICSTAVKSKADDDGAQKFADYFDWCEPLKRCSSHRLLAMRRGEAEGFLKVKITIDDEEAIERLTSRWHAEGRRMQLVADAIRDGYKRLLQPQIETEAARDSKEKADAEAIRVFADNLRQLLLSAPLGQHRVMGIDPGFRTGCKVVCLDAQGALLHHEAIFPHPPVNRRMQAMVHIQQMIADYAIEAVAIGNGTASRETRAFIDDVVGQLQTDQRPQVFVVSEDGASVYSASAVAREEFPDEDVTVRGAVSIARRLIDPLSELVKIDPKSIGVGQYQHDVDQSQLKRQLDQVVESCVNQVGVDLNTASPHLLQYVSGLGPALAKNIVNYRTANGPFSSRRQLKDVPRLGANAFQQCAGFLRIANADNPLDGSAVHPERYALVERMARDQHCSVADLISNGDLRRKIDISRYVSDDVGLPTLNDIMAELEKPGRDPRCAIEEFRFADGIETIDDLMPGLTLPGIVTNITAFGVFVDIGVHQDGLVHISQLADTFVRDPNSIVRLHQHVTVKVTAIDIQRHRISLSMKGIPQGK